MARRVGAASFVALAAIVAVPLFVRAAPPQPTAAGVVLPAGSLQTIVLDRALDSAKTEPGATIPAHLRAAIVLHGQVVVPAGAPIRLVVTETRRAGAGVSGEIFLRAEALEIREDLRLPLRLTHPVLTPLLVARARDDVVLPAHAKQPQQGSDLEIPAGTLLHVRTAATLDASQLGRLIVATPAPYTISSDEPYSAFTPIPLTTFNPNYTPPPRRGRRPKTGTITPSPSPIPSVFATAAPSSSVSFPSDSPLPITPAPRAT